MQNSRQMEWRAASPRQWMILAVNNDHSAIRVQTK